MLVADIGPCDIIAHLAAGSHVDRSIDFPMEFVMDNVVGQIARYMGWVEEHLKCENVKGVIVCGKYDKKLDYARKRVRDVEVFLYEVNFSLKEYTK